MEKFKVSFIANNQQLTATGTKHASDTYADIEATFALGERWTDMDTVSAVWWNDYTRISTVLDSEGKCTVPHEVLMRKGCVRVNLVGSVVEDGELVTRLTSYSAEAVHVNEKIKLTGNEPQTITPSQFEQFVEAVRDDADRAETASTEARESATEASESATSASQSASASAESATASEQAKDLAQGYAQNAQISAQTAENAKDDAEDARDKILGMRATAETLEAGSDATASYSDGLLTLGIPRGDKGEQGDTGETGAPPNFSIGEVDTLEPNESATATITGTAENPVLNLGIPKGEQGDVSRAELDRTVTDLKSDKLNNYDSVPFSVLNERINTSGGFSGQSNMARTNYYPCVEGMSVTVNGKSFIYQGNPELLLIAFYDEGQNFISGVGKFGDESVSTLGTISATAPSGTAYVACSTNSENASYDGFYARVINANYLLRDGMEENINNLDSKLNTAIFENKSSFEASDFVQGGMTQGALVSDYTFRVASYPIFFKFDYPLTIKAKTGYKFGVHIFTDDEVFVLDPGWQTEYVVPENTKFRIVIAKVTEDHSVKASIPEFVSSLAINTKADAEISALSFTPSYYYLGEPIDFKRKGFKTSNMFSVPSVPSGTTYQQGFAIYDDVLFQLYSSNKVKLVDMSDGSTITTLDINSDHGDSIDFSNEFYDENDEFPLAYITADTNPAKVYVVRITRSATTLIRTYYFGDLSKTGYYACHALDSANNILYMVGYTENSYYLDENGTNKMIVSKWDLNDCVTNQDSTLTPTLLDSFTTQFMRTVQGQRYFDNKLFLLSSHNGAESLPINTTIYVVDPFKKIITSVFDSFPSSIKNNECEAIEFVLNNDIYDMVISNTNYYKLIFG